MKTKASVLIANYNNQKYINKCVSSLFKQSYKNIEIIFHDDGSVDNSLLKANKFKKIKIIKNNKRGKYGSFNQMAAFERAFRLSKGEIIFLLDSDDYFEKNKIEKIINFYSKNKKINAIYDLPILVEGKKKKIEKNKKKIFKTFWPYIPPQSCISIRRQSFRKYIKYINFKLFPDIWMDFRLAIYLKYIEKNFFIFNENLTCYRQNINSISSNFKFSSVNWWKRRLQAYEYIKYFFNINKISYKKNFDYYLTVVINSFLK